MDELILPPKLEFPPLQFLKIVFGKEDVIVKFLLPTSIPLTYTLSVLTWIVLLPVMYMSLYPVRDTTSI